MKLAFCLYKYFPYGGLQRDFLCIAQNCAEQGHQVTAYVLKWQGEQPDWLTVEVAPVKAFSSPRRYQKYNRWLINRLQDKPADVVVGFNKMPGLDVYYTADPCFEHKARNLRSWWYKYSSRYRHFSRYEKAIFEPGASTDILMISQIQMALFKQYYGTEDQRMTMLPPGISQDRCAPENAVEIRCQFRDEFKLVDDDLLILQIGSGFRTKGLDRSLKAMAALPEDIRVRARLFVIGQDDPTEFKLQAKKLGILGQVIFLQGRDDVPRFLLGADLLIHPAYAENTGTVLLEAVVAGLPVLVTDVCGYASYVKEAGAGEISKNPFDQQRFNRQLRDMLLADKSNWQKNGLAYAAKADIFSMPLRAVKFIEQVGMKRKV